MRKNIKKPLDKRLKVCYNMQAVHKRTATAKGFEKNLKKVEKTFKKGIDKAKRKWYNTEVAAKAGAEMILEN